MTTDTQPFPIHPAEPSASAGELAWVRVDRFGRVEAINARFTEEFGWRAGSIVGQPLLLLLPERFHDAHNIGFSRFMTFGRSTMVGQPMRLPLMTATGEIVLTECLIQAERVPDGWRFEAQVARLDPSGGA